MRHRRPRPLPKACLRLWVTACEFRFRLRLRFGCVFGFGFGFGSGLLLCCLLLAFVHGLLYFSFGYVFCPRYAGIMLLEGGLTGNSYGLQRMSRLKWPGAFN